MTALSSFAGKQAMCSRSLPLCITYTPRLVTLCGICCSRALLLSRLAAPRAARHAAAAAATSSCAAAAGATPVPALASASAALALLACPQAVALCLRMALPALRRTAVSQRHKGHSGVLAAAAAAALPDGLASHGLPARVTPACAMAATAAAASMQSHSRNWQHLLAKRDERPLPRAQLHAVSAAHP